MESLNFRMYDDDKIVIHFNNETLTVTRKIQWLNTVHIDYTLNNKKILTLSNDKLFFINRIRIEFQDLTNHIQIIKDVLKVKDDEFKCNFNSFFFSKEICTLYMNNNIIGRVNLLRDNFFKNDYLSYSITLKKSFVNNRQTKLYALIAMTMNFPLTINPT